MFVFVGVQSTPAIYRGSFCCLPFQAKACSSCEKLCKVCREERAVITLLSVHVHDES